MSDMVPEVLNAALDSLFTPKEPGEQEYQGVDGLLYCRNCHTPVQCRVKLWGRDKIVPCLCRCQQEAMAEKKRQDELVERQRKIRQLKATGIQEKHLLEWNFGVAEDNKDMKNGSLKQRSRAYDPFAEKHRRNRCCSDKRFSKVLFRQRSR